MATSGWSWHRYWVCNGSRILTFEGEIAPDGRNDFTLTAQLQGDVVQACVVSLAPGPARIDEDGAVAAIPPIWRARGRRG